MKLFRSAPFALLAPALGAALLLDAISTLDCHLHACQTDDAAIRAQDMLLTPLTIVYVLCTAFILFPAAIVLAKRIAKPAAAAIVSGTFTAMWALLLHGPAAGGPLIKMFTVLTVPLMLPWFLGAWCATALWPYEQADAAIDR